MISLETRHLLGLLVGFRGSEFEQEFRFHFFQATSVEQAYGLGAIDYLPGERALCCVAYKKNTRIAAPEIVLQVVEHSAASAHTRTRHDDRPASYLVDGD